MHTHTACACLLKVSGFRERRDRRRGCQLARSFVRGFRKIVRGRLSSRALRLCFIKGTYGQVARDTWHVTTNGLQLYMLLSFYSIVLVEKFKKSKALHGPVTLLYHPRYGFIKVFPFLRDTCRTADDVIL